MSREVYKKIAEDTVARSLRMEKTRVSQYYSARRLQEMKQEPFDSPGHDTKISHLQADVVDVLPTLSGKAAVLNFASARNPGGGFLGGSNAQEEALSRASDLYSYLKDIKEFYKNPKHFDGGLYDSDAIYSKGVTFFKNGRGGDIEPFDVDVITSCAVNVKRLKKEGRFEDLKRAGEEMRVRIENVFELAARERVETLVLGAFGCGVFGNDPYTVADLFKRVIHSARYDGAYKEISFVIYGDQRLFQIFKGIR